MGEGGELELSAGGGTEARAKRSQGAQGAPEMQRHDRGVLGP